MRAATIGCSGWNRTNTVPLNRRVNYFYPTEQLKLVSAAGLAPAVARPRPSMLLLHHALLPRRMVGAGGFVLWRWTHAFLGTQHPSEIGEPEGPCTLVAVRQHPSRRQRVAPLIELRVQWPAEPKLAPANDEVRLCVMRFGATAFARRCAGSEGWWEAVVMLHSSLPTLFCDTGFTDQQPERFP